MSNKNIKIRYIVGVIFIFIFCLNFKVIANKEYNAKPLVVDRWPYLTCSHCEPMPGQYGIRYDCPDGPILVCPFTLPCGYGDC